MRLCENCKKEITRRVHGADAGKFCSIACSNSSRKVRGKRSSDNVWGSCITCGGKTSRAKPNSVCQECKNESAAWKSVTLKELRESFSVAQYHAKIRGLARTVYKKKHPDMVCEAPGCGYKLHIDVAHIKAVADFDDSATLGEVNSVDNLIGLDKRCHWEFDNGYLNLGAEWSSSV